MFTVEFESDASIITTLDQQDAYEDVEMDILSHKDNIYAPQLDRIEPDKGYIEELDAILKWMKGN